MADDYQKDAERLLEPILTLMGGADGGVAFSKLRHDLLPTFFKQHFEDGDMNAEQLIHIIARFSRLCQLILDKKL